MRTHHIGRTSTEFSPGGLETWDRLMTLKSYVCMYAVSPKLRARNSGFRCIYSTVMSMFSSMVFLIFKNNEYGECPFSYRVWRLARCSRRNVVILVLIYLGLNARLSSSLSSGCEAGQVWSHENHSMINILRNNSGGKCFA